MKPPFIKKAFVYALNDSIYLNTVVRTRNGWGIGVPSISAVSASEATIIGRELMAALSASVDNVSDDTDPKESLKAILAASKMKSWSQFSRKAKLVLASKKPREKVIALTLTKYLGGSLGSDHLDDKSLQCSTDFPELLGAAVLSAVSLCE